MADVDFSCPFQSLGYNGKMVYRCRGLDLLMVMVCSSLIEVIPTLVVYLFLYFRATARLCLHMNSAVNIFIYAGRLSEFRSALRKDLSKMRLWPVTMGPCVRVSPEPEARSG